MPPIDRATFYKYWRETEIIREYKKMLSTFSDTKLPYIFAGEHHLGDRAVVTKGIVFFQRPTIILPGYGPQFKEGFEHADAMPDDMVAFFRIMGLPYCNIHNQVIREQRLEYGSLQSILNKYYAKLEADEDTETALIKGAVKGTDISLMQYSLKLSRESAPKNIKHFIEHLRRDGDEPISPDESLTEEDIRKLFE